LLSIYKKFIQHAKEESYKALGLSLSSDAARLAKSYEDTKSWAASNALETKVSRSASSIVKSWHKSSMFRPGSWFLNSAVAWATTEEIIMLKELSRLDEVFWADSNNSLWFFKSSSAAFSRLSAFYSRSIASSARITWKSRVFDLLSNLSRVAAREDYVFSSSNAKVVLASWDCWRDYSAACLATFSSAREFSTPNRADFSSNSAFCAAFKSLANTANREGLKLAKEIKRKK
jgi:hypothetical protein